MGIQTVVDDTLGASAGRIVFEKEPTSPRIVGTVQLKPNGGGVMGTELVYSAQGMVPNLTLALPHHYGIW